MWRSKRIVWDDWNREHIQRHAVAVHEVDEVLARRTIRKLTDKGRLLLIGTTRHDGDRSNGLRRRWP